MSIIPPHDPLCPMAVGPPIADRGPLAYCQCDLIRRATAREREAVKAEYVPVLLAHLQHLADLRDKVQALNDTVSIVTAYGVGYDRAIRDVLALIDGSSDE